MPRRIESRPPSKTRRAILAMASAVFLVVLWFAPDLYVSARRYLAEPWQSQAVDQEALERSRTERVNALVRGAVSASESAIGFYQDHLAALHDSERLPSDLLGSGTHLTDDARLRIAVAQGAIAGVFPNDLDPSVVVLRTGLLRINTSMALLAEFFRGYSTQGPALAIRQLRAADTWIGADSMDAEFSRLRAWE